MIAEAADIIMLTLAFGAIVGMVVHIIRAEV